MGQFLLTTPWPGFSPHIEIAICYCLSQGRFLFLRRCEKKADGGQWTAPSGKLEKEEIPLLAAQRELFEETGLQARLEELHSLGSYYASRETFHLKIHLFCVFLDVKDPHVVLSLKEHDAFKWVTSAEVLSLPLMYGAQECFQTATSIMEKSDVRNKFSSYLSKL